MPRIPPIKATIPTSTLVRMMVRLGTRIPRCRHAAVPVTLSPGILDGWGGFRPCIGRERAILERSEPIPGNACVQPPLQPVLGGAEGADEVAVAAEALVA